MNFVQKSILLLGLSTAFAAQAATHIPADIFRPQRAQVIKAQAQGDGEFEADFRVRGGTVRSLANQAMRHARAKGYRLTEHDISNDDADLTFVKGNRELDISIELKDNYIIEIEENLDINN